MGNVSDNLLLARLRKAAWPKCAEDREDESRSPTAQGPVKPLKTHRTAATQGHGSPPKYAVQVRFLKKRGGWHGPLLCEQQPASEWRSWSPCRGMLLARVSEQHDLSWKLHKLCPGS